MPNPKLETYKNKATGTVYDFTDADAQSKVTATVDLLRDTTGWLGGNKLENKLTSQTLSNVAVTVNDDKSINLNGTPSSNITSLFINTNINLKAGKYYLSGNPSGVTGNEYGLRISNADFSLNYFFEQGKVFELAQDTNDLRVDIRVPQGRQCNNELFYPMICKLATHGISPFYRPYHESVEEMLTPKSLPNNADLNNYTNEGDYIADASVNTYTNIPPVGTTSFRFKVLPCNASASRCVQIIIVNKAEPEVYMRTNFGGTWQSWYKFAGTVVS